MNLYLVINTNTDPQICENVVVWDGDTTKWTPPSDKLFLKKEEVYSLDWQWTTSSNTWVLTETLGYGDIGFTWDGEKLTTNRPKPS